MTTAGKRFTSVLEASHNKLWGCHFRVPPAITRSLIDGSSRRVICTLNESATYQCALMPFGNGSFVISVNKKLRDTLGLAPGSTVSVQLRRDETKYGLPMPPELEELLRQDSQARKLFHALTPGKQRTLLFIAGGVKNPEKRLHRALAIVRHLITNGGKINYRMLNASLRETNRL